MCFLERILLFIPLGVKVKPSGCNFLKKLSSATASVLTLMLQF
jgi:hypothetical protein